MKQRWVARGLVAGLHLALLAALWLYKPAGLDGHREQRLTTVRLILPPPPRATAPEPTRPREPVPKPQAAPALIPPPPVTIDTPQPPAGAAPSPAPPVAQPPTTEPPRATLRLTLPPGYAASSAAARNPALADPRSNTARLTLEDRIADATGGAGAWVEEPADNHSLAVGAQGDRRTVLRRGNTCVEVFRSRIADSDPFNNGVAPRTMAMVGQPYKCR